ncbi:TetR/AcrR family transcriptional regulator [Nocardia stercoris]|uniref:TetR/AcrR family transcriptional regulator n=1 Tax=Nocardia stercoris TaxID=2483361 RepID=A0A3M2LCN1_9NOCA|nr:TetR/AcrR family transcriptional regulator [Nocardia stercoris]RMI35281.1 TetR/AcrR family transcriptional regulator [Nocardia stercoris]
MVAADGSDGPGQRTQAQRRHDSRSALIEAALDLVAAGDSFEGLSLRKVAGTAGLAPSAFYRYFDSMESLGVAVVEESFRRFREQLATMDGPPGFDATEVLSTVVDLILAYARREHRYVGFVVRQRTAGNIAVRRLIRAELRVLVNQTATLLARNAPINQWPAKDIKMLATMLVTLLTVSLDSALEVLSGGGSRDETSTLAEVATGTKRQVAYLLQGTVAWHPGK